MPEEYDITLSELLSHSLSVLLNSLIKSIKQQVGYSRHISRYLLCFLRFQQLADIYQY